MACLILYFRVAPYNLSNVAKRRRGTLTLSLWLLAALAFAVVGCSEEPIELGATVYNGHAQGKACEAGSRTGDTGLINDQSTDDGIQYNVRTPSNYISKVAHPLLVVYSPARRSRSSTERFTRLTKEATTAGFVVAYVDHQPMSKTAILKLSVIPDLIAKNWCIDKNRIYLTGHSDGGSMAMGLAFFPEIGPVASAIAPSGVGIKGSDLTRYPCPDPMPVMVMHSAEDSHFPGYGVEAVAWWAACNRCDSETSQPMANGCVVYPNCAENVKTWYCEGKGSHAAWPESNRIILDFFKSPFNAN